MNVKTYASMTKLNRVIYEHLVENKVEHLELIDDNALQVLAELIFGMKERLKKLDSDKEKITFLENLVVTVAATDILRMKKMFKE